MFLLEKIGLGFRMMARLSDYCLCYLLISAIMFALPYFYPPYFYLICAGLTPFIWIPIEALCISRWGRTPGKALFGLAVHTAEGFMLSYRQAFKRACFSPSRPGLICQSPISWKRKMMAVAVGVVCVVASLYGNSLALWTTGLNERSDLNGWVQYASDEAGFKVAFPKDPEAISKELAIPNSDKVLSYQEVTSQESRKVSYSVSHLTLPKKWRLASNTTLLKGVLDILIKHSEGAVLVDKEFKKHGSARVLDYRILQGSDEMKGRLVIFNGILYKLTVTYPQSKGDDAQIVAFLDSFEVVS